MKKENKDTKQKLFEMMSKIDSSYKPSLNESFEIPTNNTQPVDEKMIGKKPTGKRDSVTYYKGEGAFPGYTHFAIIKADTPFEGGMLKTANKIFNGWDYRGYDSEDLKSDKSYYFTGDIRDMDINPKLTVVVTAEYLKKRGIDPYNYANWITNDEMSKFMQSQY